MIAAVDVLYDEDAPLARAAMVLFDQFTDAAAHDERVREFDEFAPYVPGRFFERELPCLLPMLTEVPDLRVVVVDGYVDLGPRGAGLGRHLHDALGHPELEVIGVAKTAFHEADPVEVLRGTSKRPLFVTSTHDASAAAEHVRTMHGPHRMPTLLKRVDQLTR